MRSTGGARVGDPPGPGPAPAPRPQGADHARRPGADPGRAAGARRPGRPGVAERAIARQAEREVANQNVSSSPPEVSIGGFPFLTQVLAEKYDSITIVARDASGEVQGETVELPRLEIVARDVHASLDTIRSGQGDVIAQTVDGTGVVGYDSVARASSTSPGGARRAERQADRHRRRWSSSGSSSPSTASASSSSTRRAGADALREPHRRRAARHPAGADAADQLRPAALHPVPLPELPYQIGCPRSVRCRRAWRSPPTAKTCRSTPSDRR